MDLPGWIQAACAAVVVGGSIWGAIEVRIARAHKAAHQRIDREVLSLTNAIEDEGTERKRDVARIDVELGGLGALRESVGALGATVSSAFERSAAGTALIGEQVKALTDRFTDFKSSNDRATDEIKHSVRNLQDQVQGLAVGQARRRPLDEG
jgi:phage-related protein